MSGGICYLDRDCALYRVEVRVRVCVRFMVKVRALDGFVVVFLYKCSGKE